MKQAFFLLLFVSLSLFAQNQDVNTSLTIEEAQEKLEEEQKKHRITDYLSDLEKIEEKIAKEKVWMKSYASYMTSLDIRSKLDNIKNRIKFLKKNGSTISELDELNALISKEKILASQIEKLKEKGTAPFSKLLTPPEIEETSEITNPLDIFTGISLIKTQNAYLSDYISRKEELASLVILLRKEKSIYEDIKKIDKEKKYLDSLENKEKQLKRFETALDTMSVTAEVYQKRLEIIEVNINKDIEKQAMRLVNIGIIILVLFIFFFLLKLIVKKYITDNERFYMANKIITFANVTLVILIIFFNYIENVSYLVTILGFASAGIAIAMKDWFMSILGWLVLVFGGSIHVGDRIRVIMDGTEYVGDVMDISLLRMTVFEDITLTSVSVNRRAGRIVFVPNNYVFTRMIANYAHHSLKTVWDGVHITVTFDSNHKKAMHIAKEVCKKYSKGYTDITRKQLNKLRSHYSLKNTNVEPRIFSFIEPNGVMIDAWYLTNAYATLTLRSVISVDIVEAYNKEDDITIAYPTQRLHLQQEAPRTPPFDTNSETL
ncbi:MAG: mechanosensitive ion channel [Helicobacteraceae bacterium]|nr:mechanosensitive ion channel [Candidatus Sulfurimonas ponti]MBL6973144.1 mechanosensitive ion channel [Sulfurimonas sp.]